MKNFANAAELFKRVPAFHKESDKAALALFESSKYYLQIKDSKSALAVLFEIISNYPQSPERVDAHLRIVEIYLDRGDFSEALAQIENVFRTFGPDLKDPRVYLLRARVYEQLGQFDEAHEIYSKIVEEFRTSTEAQKVLYHLGSLLQSRGDLNKALTYYDQYLIDFKGSESAPKVHLKKGDIYLAKEEFDKASESYQTAEQNAPPKLQNEINYKIAMILDLQAKYHLAETRLRRIIENKDESKAENGYSSFVENCYFKLTEVLIKSGQAQKALKNITEYKKRFSESPKLKKIQFVEAGIFENLQDYTRALRAYQIYKDDFPRSLTVDDAQAGIARCYEELNEYRLALAEYRNYLAQYPGGDDFDWVKNKVRLIPETINIDTGLHPVSDLLTKFADAKGTENWNFELGKYYFQIKEFGLAIDTFKKILSVPGNGLSRAAFVYHLGLSYFNMADKFILNDEPEKSTSYLDSAMVQLRQITKEYPDVRKLEDACFMLAKIELDTLTRANKQARLLKLHTDWQQNFPNGKYRNFILIQLADSYFETAANDSVSAISALAFYKLIQEYLP